MKKRNELYLLTPVLILLVGLLVAGCGSNGDSAAGVESVFANMEQAIKNQDEALFKAQWHAEGYRNNLVGGSGLSGEEVFEEASGEGWYLKPNLEAATQREGVYLIPTDIWFEDEAVDEVYAAVVSQNDKWIMLGAGEASEEVEALIDRYLADEPLTVAE